MRFSNFLIVCAMVLPMGAWGETVNGLAVEVVRAAFRLMDQEVLIGSYPWARSQRMFEKGEADGIFTYFKNPQREEYTLFGKEPVETQTISRWVLKDSKIEFNGDLNKLRPYRFGLVNTVSYGERFDAAVKCELLRTDVAHSIESCISKLLAEEPL